jgi:hypothetical protein
MKSGRVASTLPNCGHALIHGIDELELRSAIRMRTCKAIAPLTEGRAPIKINLD